VKLAEGGRTEGTFCPFGHVRSICTSTERVIGVVGPLLEPATAALEEPTTAAAVRPPGADLPSLSVWIKMPLGTEVGLGPSNIALDGDLQLPHGKGYNSPHFSAHVYFGQTVAHLINC